MSLKRTAADSTRPCFFLGKDLIFIHMQVVMRHDVQNMPQMLEWIKNIKYVG